MLHSNKLYIVYSGVLLYALFAGVGCLLFCLVVGVVLVVKLIVPVG